MLDRPEPTIPSASEPDTEVLLALARHAAATLSGEAGVMGSEGDQEYWIGRTAEVLAVNLASGRLENVVRIQPDGQDGHDRLLAYACQVMVQLRAESGRIQRLVEGDGESWRAVLDRMQRLAYYRLAQAGPADWARSEAQEVAAHACAQLWDWLEKKPYPFDVPFDRWSARWLNNRLCDRARREQTRERHTGDSLDRPLDQASDLTLQDVLPDRSFDEWLEKSANREALEQAIGQLPDNLATVVRLWYFQDWCADEIGAYLGRETNYVYVLRFRAIHRLRQIAMDERFGLSTALSLMRDEQRRLQLEDANAAGHPEEGRE